MTNCDVLTNHRQCEVAVVSIFISFRLWTRDFSHSYFFFILDLMPLPQVTVENVVVMLEVMEVVRKLYLSNKTFYRKLNK
uniref:Uncharacterized protein n=1 Tax=Octopus bimaculoides TaxID=37653 RepID=A0A0L8G344_OCTBM